ncbi:hypothetical protein A1O1_03274 [Capronia coronata CBS 617.96]|uniref:NCS1 family nucleobase:cation symporter-1 n=1 Tax=Capronia coronata CBS 617.96 TaxID=1182541 RepID=W9YYY7_9EURO|nr:uncharacterized protein A1O1_03274 [Capronia coronata CBS 617.96]EXJ94875.1 hypothetical protein A1O1_03274 [Capronia coronata CBS 617.96]
MEACSQYVSRKAASAQKHLTSIDAWKLEKTPSAFTPEGQASNYDMEPVPRELWTWSTSTFIAYWMSDLLGVTGWTTVSSFMVLGLNWWESVLAVFVGGVALGVVLSVNALIGARLHTPFAITARSVYGYYFSYFPVVSRMIIGWFWFSINTYQGGLGVGQLIQAIWPSYARLPNHLSPSSGLTSYSFLNFFLFWVVQLPFIFIHPSRLRPLFLAKNIAVPITAIATMAWAVHRAGGQASEILAAKPTMSGLPMWFAFMSAVTSSMGSLSTMACNIGDFSRYSKKPAGAYLQIVIMPVTWSLISVIGAIGSQCTSVMYGQILWQPFDIIAKWQSSPGGRAAAFFASIAWIIGNIGSNITANSISAANDLTTLFPKYINIYRGQWVAATIGVFGFAPWKVLESASNLLSFMNSYSIILAPMAAILSADYVFVKKSKIDVPELYNRARGIYRFKGGFNWRAAVALVCAIGPNMPGMVNAINPAVKIGGAKYVYAIADIFGMTVGASVHVALSKMFPDKRSVIDYNLTAEAALLQHGAATELDKDLDGDLEFSLEAEKGLSEKDKMHDAESFTSAA